MALEGLRGGNNGRQARVGRPEVPTVEKLVGRSGIPVIPEVGERLLDGLNFHGAELP